MSTNRISISISEKTADKARQLREKKVNISAICAEEIERRHQAEFSTITKGDKLYDIRYIVVDKETGITCQMQFLVMAESTGHAITLIREEHDLSRISVESVQARLITRKAIHIGTSAKWKPSHWERDHK